MRCLRQGWILSLEPERFENRLASGRHDPEVGIGSRHTLKRLAVSIGVAQILKAKFSNTGDFQNRFETPFHSLTVTLRIALRRKNALVSDHSREVPNLRCQP